MDDVKRIDDDGYMTIAIGDVERQVDVYMAHNTLVQVRLDREDRPVEETHQGLADVVESLGFPRVSHRAAAAFALAVAAKVEELRKKDESASSPSTSAASPASTASPSSA